jgi:hypothetical protein
VEHIAFGAFNPRFYGVSLLLSDASRLDAIRTYMSADDIATWAKSSTLSLSEAAMLSASDHELRHFHDFLLSPFGTAIMGLRMQASINGIQAMKLTQKVPGRFLPVPLMRWISWDTERRRRWVLDTGSFFGIETDDDIVPIPHASELSEIDVKIGLTAVNETSPIKEQLSKYVLLSALSYASMDRLRQDRFSQHNIDLNADDLFESTAHLVQLQAIWTGQGEEALKAFFNFVLGSKTKQLKPLQLLFAALQEQPLTFHRLLEIFTWILFGSSKNLLGSLKNVWSAEHPAKRYLQVITLTSEASVRDFLTHPMNVDQLFEFLDEATESGSWRHNLQDAMASADRRHDVYLKAAKSLNGGFFDALFNVARMWHHDQLLARNTLAQDPDSFTNPLRYITERRYPTPFMETRFGEGVHLRDTPLNLPHISTICADQDGKQVIAYIGRPTSIISGGETESVSDARSVRDARIATHMIDFLFSDEPISDLYERWCRNLVMGITEKKLISVY